MGYNRENYRRVKEAFREKRARAQQAATARRREVDEKISELREIDDALSKTARLIMLETTKGETGLAERIEQLKQENLELQSIRGDMLERNGYPRNYTSVQYECNLCDDTGFLDCVLCPCMKKELAMAGYESSGMAGLMKTQRFDTFSLDYYKGEEQFSMKRNVDTCRRFAEQFGDGNRGNLLFMGKTGTGKTHLSTAIAKMVIDNGYDVVYETATNLFGDFEDEQFGVSSMRKTDEESKTAKYFDGDLLILDDLGTEMSNQFTVSCLYNLINTRINRKKSTIISTNLNTPELEKKYSERICSRLMGEYAVLMFRGCDIRMQKLRKM